MDDKFLKRLHKKAKKGLRGWPLATVAFYGPDLGRATKVTVGIMPAHAAPATAMRAWSIIDGDIRRDPDVAAEMLDFIAEHGALSVGIAGAILGCPHQQGIDYDGDWCPDPACAFWHGRDRWTGEPVA
ncbi:MAG: hypothetical protein JWR49_25 [Tardiphaga sp.]|nr:hypothetical protein [Tardiphaga sp.]